MKRIHIFLDEGMLEHLQALPGTTSEHIREAIYDYLLKLEKLKTSSSNSKVGDKNG